jgi:hypothetical protein
MSNPSTPASSDSSPFAHLDEMIAAYEGATNPEEKRMFLRGVVRTLEHVSGKTHAALAALTKAVTAEGK